MSAIALLMGLLVLSYLGSVLVWTGKTRGLPSGIEFIGLGFVVGPHALGLVGTPMIVDFEPIVHVALGWLAFGVGLDFGRVEGRRVRTSSTVLGIGGAVLTGLIVGVAVHFLLASAEIPGVDRKGSILLAAGAGAVSAETAHYAVEWVKARWGAKGPIARLLVDIGAADDLAPLVAAGAIFAMAPSHQAAIALPAWGWFSVSVVLGALLGVVTALLLRGAEGDAVWGALIGTILLGVGAAARFGLCTIFVTFVLGLALATTSPNRRALRKMVGPTEQAVLYPMLVLAGARIDPRPVFDNPMLAAIVVLVLLARIVGKLASGVVVRTMAHEARPAGAWLGIVLLSSGPVSIACGLLFALRFPGAIGDTLLVCAVASAVVGEVSTLSVKALLTEVGEIVPAPARAPSAPPPPSVPVRGSSMPPPPPSPDPSRTDIASLEEEEGPAE